MKKIALAISPTLALLGIFFYFWSRNLTLFTHSAIFVSTIVLLSWGLLAFVICYKLIPFLITTFIVPKHYRLFYGLLISAIIIFPIFYMVDLHLWMQRKLWGIIAFLLIFFLIYLKKEKLIVIFLSILLAIQIGNTGYNYISLFREQADLIADMNENLEVPKFKHKPNIYIYWLESYQDLSVLRTIFKMNVDDFENFLLSKHFTIKANVRSGAVYTLHAMAQLYTMSNLEKAQSWPGENSEVFWNVRDIIGGNKYNFVYKALKENGYRTYQIYNGEWQWYYFSRQGEFLDETGFDYPTAQKYLQPISMFIFPYYAEVLNHLTNPGSKVYIPLHDYGDSLVDNLKNAIKRGKANGQPFVLTIKGGAEHTDGTGYTWKNREEWINSQRYQNLVQNANKETEDIVNYIISKDPNSIILIMGDHGPLTLRGFPHRDEEMREKTGITLNDYVNDIISVFFAWRMPDGINYDLSQGMYINNVNVFTHIFAWMAEDPEFLKTRSASKAKVADMLIREGKVFE